MEENTVKKNPYAKYHVDENAVKVGVIYQDEDNRVRVTYAGEENSRYTKMLKLKLKPLETRIRNDNLPDKEFYRLLAEVYAATVVLGWEVNVGTEEKPFWQEGVFDVEGTVIQANEFAIIQAFTLGERLFQDVIKVATNFNLFRQCQKEEDGKNL